MATLSFSSPSLLAHNPPPAHPSLLLSLSSSPICGLSYPGGLCYWEGQMLREDCSHQLPSRDPEVREANISVRTVRGHCWHGPSEKSCGWVVLGLREQSCPGPRVPLGFISVSRPPGHQGHSLTLGVASQSTVKWAPSRASTESPVIFLYTLGCAQELGCHGAFCSLPLK